MTYEGLRLKVLTYWRKMLAAQRRKHLKSTDFTIISNNCWGGMIYESYGLPKGSPTVGLFFMSEDYIKFLTNLEAYLAAELIFIHPEQSHWKEQVCSDRRYGSYPVGTLSITRSGGMETVEIFFLHAHSEQEAKEKWERRIKRINRKRLLIKFNDQNGCTEEQIRAFDALPFQNKVCFSVKAYPQYPSVVQIRVPGNQTFVKASYEPFGNNRNININTLLNRMTCEGE